MERSSHAIVQTVPAQNLRVVLDTAAERGAPAAAICEAVGLDPRLLDDSAARVPLEIASDTYDEAARRTGDDAFGFHVAERSDFFAFDALGLAVSTKQNLKQAFEHLQPAIVALHGIRMELEVVGDLAHLAVTLPEEGLRPCRHRTEAFVARVVRMIELATGNRPRLRRVAFKYERPASVAEHERIFASLLGFSLLVEVEKTIFKDALDAFLKRVRLGLDKTGALLATRAHLDTYLAVAHSLLRDSTVTASGGGDPEQIESLVALAHAAGGSERVSVFGRERIVDFSQFKPRGHYEKHPELIPYFRAMVWLGQTDFRATEIGPAGSSQLRRVDFDAFVAVREAMDKQAIELWRIIDRLVSFFVGQHDSMTVEGLDRLVRELGAGSVTDLYRVSDRDVERALRRTRLGKQQIAGHVYVKHPGDPRLELNTSMALFGQRYSLDSHALHSVTENRVPLRDLPSSRDVAFATFGNGRGSGRCARCHPVSSGHQRPRSRTPSPGRAAYSPRSSPRGASSATTRSCTRSSRIRRTALASIRTPTWIRTRSSSVVWRRRRTWGSASSHRRAGWPAPPSKRV